MCGNTFPGETPAYSHKLFISLQILLRSSGLPLLVTKMIPEFIFCSVAYRSSFFSQGTDNKYLSCFSLAGYNGFSFTYSLHRNTLQFTNPNACPANRLNDEGKPFVFLLLSCPYKCRVFRFGKFLFLGTVRFFLHLKLLYTKITPAEKSKKELRAANIEFALLIA